jgi:hypothetical protein
MLVPSPAASGSGDVSGAERLMLTRAKKGGQWVELQIARPNDEPDRRSFERWQERSRFLSPDVMAVLHEPFARALPGFDSFLPRLFDRAALEQLRGELTRFNGSLRSVETLEAAKGKWGAGWIAELPGDDAWIAARGTLAATVDELSSWAAGLAAKGDGLWVLGG